MNEVLQENLFAIEPGWFKRDDPKTSLMCFGFETGPGWYPLIRALLWHAKGRQKRWDQDYENYCRWKNNGFIGALKQEKQWIWNDTIKRYNEVLAKGEKPWFSLPKRYKIVKSLYKCAKYWFRQRKEYHEKFATWNKRVANGKPGNPFAVGNFAIEQVKQKYGELRYYYYGGDEDFYAAVRAAETFSHYICETCGKAGQPNDGGWITTLCDTCAPLDRIKGELPAVW